MNFAGATGRVVAWTIAGAVATFLIIYFAGLHIANAAFFAALSIVPWGGVSLLSAIAAFGPKRGVHFVVCQVLIGCTFVASYFLSVSWAAAPVPSEIPASIQIWCPLMTFAVLFAFGLIRSTAFSRPKSSAHEEPASEQIQRSD